MTQAAGDTTIERELQDMLERANSCEIPVHGHQHPFGGPPAECTKQPVALLVHTCDGKALLACSVVVSIWMDVSDTPGVVCEHQVEIAQSMTIITI